MNKHRLVVYVIVCIASLLPPCFALDEKNPLNQMFSRGLRLIVEVPDVHVDQLATPKVHVLLAAGVQIRPPERKKHSERLILACVITGLQSKAVRITWKVNGATVLKKHASSPQLQREPGGTFSAVGLYSVLDQKSSRENLYKCEVTYKGPFYYDKAESSLCRPSEGL